MDSETEMDLALEIVEVPSEFGGKLKSLNEWNPRGAPLLEPVTGQLIDMDDLNSLAEAIQIIRDEKQRLDICLSLITEAVVEHSKRQGTKTLNAKKCSLVVSADHEITYDVEALGALVDAGLPEERWYALVTPTVEYKVDRSVIKQLAANNPAYAEIIENAEQWKPKKQYVSVK